ncbi:hypothetical protein RJT34_10096 [Clitoria ternatea]|uniref:Uncharacterized protein n=1 Tax=Clitoria ternatea TaxID=43366 RepID=A0AAN9K7N5_CLITE
MKLRTDNYLPNVTDITCMDPNRAPVLAEVCKTLRLLGIIIQNGVYKSKVVHDVQHVMKRGKNIGKALNHAMLRHHEALTCRPRDAHVSPLEYQFSCSGSPPRLSQRKMSPSHRAVRLCRGAESDAVVGHYVPIERRVKMGGTMLKDRVEKDFHVDEAAEEFIARFYRDLRVQKWLDQCYW